MKIHVVLEIVYGNEGNPGINAFRSKESADVCEKKLIAENGAALLDGDVLIVNQEIEVED